MKFIVQDTFSIKKVLIFGGFGLCRFQHKVGMNSFPMRMNVISYGTNSFPWGMYSFRSKIPIVNNAQGHHDLTHRQCTVGAGEKYFHARLMLKERILD